MAEVAADLAAFAGYEFAVAPEPAAGSPVEPRLSSLMKLRLRGAARLSALCIFIK